MNSKKVMKRTRISRETERLIENTLKQERLEAKVKVERTKDEERLAAERLKKGLRYARKIFVWAKAFIQSEDGQQLMRVSHLPRASECIFFFEDEGGSYIRLGVTFRGLFWDNWMTCLPIFHSMSSPEGLASSVDTKILKCAYEQIESGKVWECIDKGFNYLKERRALT